MVSLSAIDGVIAVIGMMESADVLYARAMHSFTGSFANVGLEYELRQDITPDPELLDVLHDRVTLLCEKSQAKLTGDLRYQLLEGTKANESIPDLKKRVKEVFDGSDFEIERIARNEVIDASKDGRQQAFEKSGVKYKQWKCAAGERTCDACKRMDGQVVEITANFVDPLTGEEFYTTHRHPLCRCTELPMMRPTVPVPKRPRTRKTKEDTWKPATTVPIKEMRIGQEGRPI